MISNPKNKFIKNPIFLSYTSLSDFLKCPNSYYLKNIYRDPNTGNRVQIASPFLSLGSTVHDSIKWFLDMQGMATEAQLEDKFRNLWRKYTGKRGGFNSKEEEALFGQRGLKMLANFYKNWKVLGKSAQQITFPKYNLLEDVILMGNFDYVEEKEDGSLHIIDFKTGTKDEDDATQLYIYAILAEANLNRPVSGASFWYLDREDAPKPIVLDGLEDKLAWLNEKAAELKRALGSGQWLCSRPDTCRDCLDYQSLLDGKLEFQFTDERYHKDIYYLKRSN